MTKKNEEKYMKVLLISPIAPPRGGIATWTNEYMKVAQNVGLDVKCVNTNYINLDKIVTGKRNFIYEIKRSINIWKRVRDQSKELKPNIIHISSACSLQGNIRDIITIIMAKKGNKAAKVVLHCHCNLNDYVGKGKVSINVFKKLCNITNAVLVLNNSSEKYAKELYIENVFKIPNFLMDSVEKFEKKKNDKLRVLFIGRQTYMKGIDVVFKAASLAEKNNDSFIFDVIGDDNEYVYEIGHIPSNVVRHGTLSHDEVLEFMSKDDIFVLASRSEGFPYAVLEAMMQSMPIIATDVGAVGEMLEGTQAKIIPQDDAQALYSAILDYSSVDLRHSIGESVREKYGNCYSSKVAMDKIAEIYRRI